MKSLIKTSALILTFTLLITNNIISSESVPLKRLSTVTSPITKIELNNNNIDFSFDDEKYINDIPFNTIFITERYLYNQAINLSFTFVEENYIDDIPFNTNSITTSYNFNKALSVDFNFEEEDFVKDIEL